jgi:putative nucleotidyltransferase with HDIG domain
MLTHHAQTVILTDRHVDGALATELPRALHPPNGAPDREVSAFNFLKELSEDLVAKTLRLPSLQEVAIKVRHALVDDPRNTAQVTRVIGADPVLAVRVVCAARAGCSSPVRDLPTAIRVLGLEHAYALAMSVSLEQLLHARVPDELRVTLRAEWEHSLRVASIAQALARSVALLNADEAYLAGLLHGVGKLYILRRTANHPELLKNPEVLCRVINAWHHSVGFALMNHWGFALEFARAVNDYASVDVVGPQTPTLAMLVHVANRLAHAMGRGEALEFPCCRSLEIAAPLWGSIVAGAELDLQHLHHVLAM